MSTTTKCKLLMAIWNCDYIYYTRIKVAVIVNVIVKWIDTYDNWFFICQNSVGYRDYHFSNPYFFYCFSYLLYLLRGLRRIQLLFVEILFQFNSWIICIISPYNITFWKVNQNLHNHRTFKLFRTMKSNDFSKLFIVIHHSWNCFLQFILPWLSASRSGQSLERIVVVFCSGNSPETDKIIIISLEWYYLSFFVW